MNSTNSTETAEILHLLGLCLAVRSAPLGREKLAGFVHNPEYPKTLKVKAESSLKAFKMYDSNSDALS